jgi:hypothetical protein
MAYLPEDRGEIARDVAPEPRREALPDLAGLDRHDAKASPATVSRSRSASTLSFGDARDRSGCGSRSVADRVSVRTQPDPDSAVVLSGTTSADNLFLWIDVGPGADAQGVAFPPADVMAAGGLAPTNLPRTMIVRTNRVPGTEAMPSDLTPRGGTFAFDGTTQVSGYQPHTADLWYAIGVGGAGSVARCSLTGLGGAVPASCLP